MRWTRQWTRKENGSPSLPPSSNAIPRGKFPPMLPLVGAFLLATSACVSGSTDPGLDTFAGEWCTLGGLASSNEPAPGAVFVGMVLFQEGSEIFGTGSVSPPDSDEVFPSRYFGTRTGRTASLLRTDLETDQETPGPTFNLELTLEGERDIVGTLVGDAPYTGEVRLVRLGPRCFADT